MKRFTCLAVPVAVLAATILLGSTNVGAQAQSVADPQAAPQKAEVPPRPEMGRMWERGMMGRGSCCWCCGCGMMGRHGMGGMMGRPMMGGGWEARNPKLAAKMMEMRAEIMKARAAIIEKYAKELEAGK